MRSLRIEKAMADAGRIRSSVGVIVAASHLDQECHATAFAGLRACLILLRPRYTLDVYPRTDVGSGC